ncbi:nesprin-3 isoform X6 [Saimiri boliviensis]|uniref:nesprin-3 isoform X6 n=1 Tax=Saimiri boliviensis TaxID=27679 RepID=UPI003D76D89F
MRLAVPSLQNHSPAGAMTQQPQEDFDRSVEDAQAWMKAVQDQLQVNDNTQGPRAALEARLRETEKICQLEPEGRVKVDLVLQTAEALLACCPGDQKPEILARLKDIKAQWEETVTYMTHCHSRIEWVWLHWSEYLLARDEFYRWFQKMMVTLEPHIELQLGLKEKQWQLSHAQVLLHNVDNQAVLLDRLLEEAASLFNRIGDPSVDEDAQKRMKAEYDAVKAKAQNRVDLLEQVAQEHEAYQAGVDEFQLWLKAVVEKVNGCMGRDCKLPITQRLFTLQDIAKDFPRGEKSLERLEEQAVGVNRNTSPLGAEKITGELEEMRNVLEKLRALLEEEVERLRGLLKSRGACEQQIKRLEAELSEFRTVLQRLAQEGLQPAAKAGTKDELVAHWRRYSATQAALASEEPRVARLQAQLKELMVFPHDLQPLSDSVVAAIQEYQSLKGRSARLRNAAGVELWQHFQRPLQDLQLWRALAQRLLEVTASLPDLPSLHTFLPQIEAALMESSRLKEPLTMLQLKKDLLMGVFGQERAMALLEQVAGSVRDRDLLHNSLLQRKSKLQSLLAQHKDFGAAFEPLQRKLLDLQARVQAEKGLQRDLPGKQAQLSRLQELQEEGLDLGAQMEAARPLIQENPNHQHKMDQLSSDLQALQRSLEVIHQEWNGPCGQVSAECAGALYLQPPAAGATAVDHCDHAKAGGTPRRRGPGHCRVPRGGVREAGGRIPGEGGPAVPGGSAGLAGDGEVLSGGCWRGAGRARGAGSVMAGLEAAGRKSVEKLASAEDGSGFGEENGFHQQHPEVRVSHQPRKSDSQASSTGRSSPGGRREP